MVIDLKITPRQQAFIAATADEVLFGGAAGGGKSYGQLIDALLYAMRYKGSQQLILRRTYPELERSLIRTAMQIYPRGLYTYNGSKHTMTMVNGSIIEFGYCDRETDIYNYQSAQYHVIRFDELTHFTEQMYIYLISRLRGADDYPKQVKSSTNPGGVGHAWVKARFVDPSPPDTEFATDTGTRIFLPSKVQDNTFLLDADPGYIQRLHNLGEQDRKALLYGEWDIFDEQYFSEFDRAVHVLEPFPLPDYWRRYVALDYGMDMLACYWIAVDEQGRAYVYKELYESGLIVPDAVQAIKGMVSERIDAYYAPPDLWGRHNNTGESTAEMFARMGIPLIRASNQRVHGWRALREWLRPTLDEQGNTIANLRIFSNCVNLIRCLPSLQRDKRNQDDVATDPHELTHAPDAIRYFVAGRPSPTVIEPERDPDDAPEYDEQVMEFMDYGL